jgi:hypothetical protein
MVAKIGWNSTWIHRITQPSVPLTLNIFIFLQFLFLISVAVPTTTYAPAQGMNIYLLNSTQTLMWSSFNDFLHLNMGQWSYGSLFVYLFEGV